MLISKALEPMIRAFSKRVWGRAGLTMKITDSGSLRLGDLPGCHKAIGSPVGADTSFLLRQIRWNCGVSRKQCCKTYAQEGGGGEQQMEQGQDFDETRCRCEDIYTTE